MTADGRPVRTVLVAGVAMGILGDLLLRGSEGLALNFFLLFLGLTAAIGLVTLRAGVSLSRESIACIAIGVLLATGLIWRGSTALRAIAFLSASAAFTLPALHAGNAWLRRAGVMELVESVLGSGLHTASGGLLLLAARKRTIVGSRPRPGIAWSVARAIGGGTLLAALPLLVFGSLLVSADQVFAGLVADLVRIDVETLVSRTIVIAVLSWLACGYLWGLLIGTRLDGVRALDFSRPSLGAFEIGTALALIDLLFLGFVWIQIRYLFGGAGLVEVTPGLTYSEYARAGVFQLVIIAALVVPWLLTLHWLTPSSPRAGAVFAGLGGLQLLLLLLIVGSAFHRMAAYQAAYGLTEQRFYATAFLTWATVWILWFGATVLRNRRGPFALGSVISAVALVAVLQITNPSAFIAGANLARSAGGEAASEIDVAYLGTLGSDAVPFLLPNLAAFPIEARCRLARRLLRDWGPGASFDWRSWNWAESRAREMVRAQSDRLRRTVAESGGCS